MKTDVLDSPKPGFYPFSLSHNQLSIPSALIYDLIEKRSRQSEIYHLFWEQILKFTLNFGGPNCKKLINHLEISDLFNGQVDLILKWVKIFK